MLDDAFLVTGVPFLASHVLPPAKLFQSFANRGEIGLTEPS